jgi:hypothetical protein
MAYTLAELLALVTKVIGDGYEPYAEDTPVDEDELYELIDEHDDSMVRAAIQYMSERHDALEIDALRTTLRDSYRGEHRTFADFVRAEERVYVEQDGKEAAAIFDKLADYVDWAAYGDTPEWSDYTAVRMYPEDDSRSTVYVFRD